MVDIAKLCQKSGTGFLDRFLVKINVVVFPQMIDGTSLKVGISFGGDFNKKSPNF